MKSSIRILKTSVALVALVAFATLAQGQNRERFGISAKAGGVNAVTGKVSVKSTDQPSRLLSSQDDLASGDVVSTSLGSQVEVLLNPGTYLRLAEKSEFVMVDNSLDNLLVRITKGSAIIEATGPDQLELHVPIVTEQQRMTIVRAGVYRINVVPGTTELFVRKGRVSLGGNNELIKGGKKATFTSAGPTIAKLTSSDKDEFDDWSKTRGQTLARANQRLSARTVSGYLSSSSWSFADVRFGRWGIWTWSPFASCYTFLPFYYGWGSPYGNYYGNYAGYGGGYYGNRINNPPVITGNSTPGGSGSGSGYPGGGSSGGSGGSSGGYGGGRGISSPPSTPSQAGPRDPDSGGRMINTIKPPIN